MEHKITIKVTVECSCGFSAPALSKRDGDNIGDVHQKAERLKREKARVEPE